MENRKYLVQLWLDGETETCIMTGLELAKHYEENDICGIGYQYSAWDMSSFGMAVKVNVYETVSPIIANRRWMEREYRDYCESEM